MKLYRHWVADARYVCLRAAQGCWRAAHAQAGARRMQAAAYTTTAPAAPPLFRSPDPGPLRSRILPAVKNRSTSSIAG